MNNDIITFLDFNPNDEIEIFGIYNHGLTKYIELKRKLIPTYCPMCGQRMHSK